jgi:hypothetical protein
MGFRNRQPRAFYGITINFNSDIATLTESEKSEKVDSNYDFYIQSFQSMVYISTAATDLKYVPLANTTNPLNDQNTFEQMNSQLIQIRIADETIFRNPVRLPLLLGNGGLPHYFQTPILIPAGQEIVVTHNNQSTYSIQAQHLFEGYYVPRGSNR